MQWYEVLEDYKNHSKQWLIEEGQGVVRDILERIRFVNTGGEKPINLCAYMFALFAASDRSFDHAEYTLFNSIFGTNWTYDEVYNYVKNNNNKAVVNKLLYVMRQDEKLGTYFTDLGMVVVAYNGVITEEEREYIEIFEDSY